MELKLHTRTPDDSILVWGAQDLRHLAIRHTGAAAWIGMLARRVQAKAWPAAVAQDTMAAEGVAEVSRLVHGIMADHAPILITLPRKKDRIFFTWGEASAHARCTIAQK